MAGAALLEALDFSDVAAEVGSMEFSTLRNSLNGGALPGAAAIGGAPQVLGMAFSSGTTRSGARFRGVRNNVFPGRGITRNINHSASSRASQRRRISTGPSSDPSSSSNQSTSSSMNNGNSDEVGVVPPPRKVSKIVQDYTSILLPYWQQLPITSSEANGSNSIDIRLNSVYDPIVGDIPATIPNDPTNRQPQGRDAFALQYQYYRVLESHIHVQWHYSGARVGVITGGTISGNVVDSTYAVGWETQNGETAGICNSLDAFMVTKHAHRQLLLPTNAGQNASGNVITEGISVAETEYNYTPSKFIAETGHVQNIPKSEFWTPVGENPQHRHILSLRCFGLNGQDPITNQMTALIYITYKVQFREYQNSAIKRIDTGDALYATGEGRIDTITGL